MMHMKYQNIFVACSLFDFSHFSKVPTFESFEHQTAKWMEKSAEKDWVLL